MTRQTRPCFASQGSSNASGLCAMIQKYKLQLGTNLFRRTRVQHFHPDFGTQGISRQVRVRAVVLHMSTIASVLLRLGGRSAEIYLSLVCSTVSTRGAPLADPGCRLDR